MTHTIERLARFLAVSRGHLLEGAMPSRRVPRRPSRDSVDDDDVDLVPFAGAEADRTSVAARAWVGRGVVAASAARPRAQASNENRPSATSLASG